MPRILITAFEPFGLTGKFLGRGNASQDVMDNIMVLDRIRYDFQLLPASREAPVELRQRLKISPPSGVLLMGEDLVKNPLHVKIEPSANAGLVLTSSFAESIAPNNRSTIGHFHCNSVYATALRWSEEVDPKAPVVFVHIPVLGNHLHHTQEVFGILEKMQAHLGEKPAADI
jgi:pyrrolidone-carboxylate peptidase